jgi:uncharacterized membrane protein
LADFASHYAPSSDGNNPAQYAADLANQIGVSPDTKINQLQSKIGQFADAIAKNEGYIYDETPQYNTPNNVSSNILGGGLGYLLGKVGDFLSPTAGKIGAALTGAGIGALVGGLPGAAIGATEQYVAGGLGDVAKSISKDITGDTTQTNGQMVQNQPETNPTTPTIEGKIQPQKLEPIVSQEHIDASNKVYQTLSDALSKREGGRNYLSSPAGQGAVQTASLFGLVGVDSNGNLNFDEDKRNDIENKVERAKDLVISSQKASNSVENIANYGNQFIQGDYQSTNSAKADASRIMQSEIKSDFGDNQDISLQDLRRAQKTHYAAAKNAYREHNGAVTPKLLAHQALGRAYGQAIQEKISPDDKELYGRLTKMSQDLTNVKNLKKKVANKRAPKNESVIKGLMNVAGKYAAIYIGDKIGGPVGAILGDMIGEKIDRKINQKFGSTTFDTPQMKTAMSILAKEEPKVYEFLDKAMEHYGIKLEPAKEEGKDVNEIIKNKKTPNLFKEGTPLDTTLEKLHKVETKKIIKKAPTTDESRSPKYKKRLLPHKAKGTSRAGLIQLPKGRQ